MENLAPWEVKKPLPKSARARLAALEPVQWHKEGMWDAGSGAQERLGDGLAIGLAASGPSCPFRSISGGAGEEREKAFRQALLGIEWTGIALDWK